MRIGLLGGLSVEHEGRRVPVSGVMQLAVLFRLAVDAGSAVSYRAIAEDIWSADAPENARAALQSIVSRLRSQLPAGTIESTAGGYRLAIGRDDVDALVFSDLVARAANAPAEGERRRLASVALSLWTGDPWVPSEDFDWFERDLRRDRAAALDLGGVSAPAAGEPGIPAPLTALVGRQGELDAISEQLDSSRLVTIIGSGGVGKTRLSIETASGVRGSILVELAPVGPDEVFAAVLAATGRELRTADGSTEATGTRERVLEALAGRPVLLVLDNCEHVIGEVAAVAEDLLGALPRLRILATSREPLAIPGEAFVSVGPLPHPSEAQLAGARPEQLLGYDAVQLFHQRAVAARGARLSDDELVSAARICARLDGLPLALELAAAKLRTMTPAEVLSGLEDRFTLLTGGFRTALPRHQTLRAMIDWSWSLLENDERAALSWLSVFPAGIDVRDAKRVAVAMALPGASLFDSLVDRSLLQRSRGRFRALETIREYGIEKLAESGDLGRARAAQVHFLLDRAAESDRDLRGPRIHQAISWFDAEDDNLAAALRYSTRVPMPEEAIALVMACGWYWIIRDRQEESMVWFEDVARIAEDIDSDSARIISVINRVARASSAAGDRDRGPDSAMVGRIAGLIAAEMPRIARGGHDLLQFLPPLLSAFADAATLGDGWMVQTTVPRGEELDLDPWPTAMLHVVRAAMAQNRGDIDDLGVDSELAVSLFTEIGDQWGLALALQMRAEWLTLQGRLDEAFDTTEASTESLRRITTSWDLAQQQGLAISILLRQGRIEAARDRVAELLAEANNTGNVRTIVQSLITAMTVTAFDRDFEGSTQHLARYDALVSTWPGMPPQLIAWAEAARARIDLLRGDPAAAEASMRDSVASALASHDYPVIGMAAIGVGMLALDRGEVSEAVRALDLSTAIVGIYDATLPEVIEIERAAVAVGLVRNVDTTQSRPKAIAALKKMAESGWQAGA